MNEEMNRQEAELNEQALAGVSGGYGDGDAIYDAGKLCCRCYTAKPSKRDCSNEHLHDLAQYLLEHGQSSVKIPSWCPYYKS